MQILRLTCGLLVHNSPGLVSVTHTWWPPSAKPPSLLTLQSAAVTSHSTGAPHSANSSDFNRRRAGRIKFKRLKGRARHEHGNIIHRRRLFKLGTLRQQSKQRGTVSMAAAHSSCGETHSNWYQRDMLQCDGHYAR